MLITEIKIGDKMKIPADQKFHPEYGHSGKVVWISEDGKTVAIQCEKRHNGKKVVFMVKINSNKWGAQPG
jgi:hypothetical protein